MRRIFSGRDGDCHWRTGNQNANTAATPSSEYAVQSRAFAFMARLEPSSCCCSNSVRMREKKPRRKKSIVMKVLKSGISVWTK
jgi:hypothetical protein